MTWAKIKPKLRQWLGLTARDAMIEEVRHLRWEVRQLQQTLAQVATKTHEIRIDQFRWRSAFLEQFTHHLLSLPRYQDPRRLSRYEHQVFSQSGEDGILAEIFKRIGVTNRFFVEIGVGDGLQNNTAYWLFQGWRGVWVEGNRDAVAFIQQHFTKEISARQLRVLHKFVTAENITELLQQADVPQTFDLLSVDIDRNTYWVWNALKNYRPRVVCVEYNALFPPDVDWKVDYHPERVWNKSSYFGASLLAFEYLGRQLGYCLVGCTLSGINAFFVHQDWCDEQIFAAPFTAENHYEPHRSYLLRPIGRPRRFHDDD